MTRSPLVRRVVPGAAGVLLGALVLSSALVAGWGTPVLEWVFTKASVLAKLSFERLADPPFLIILLVTLALERVAPADETQRTLSVGFLQDFVWFFYERALHLAVLVTFVAWMREGYAAHFSHLTVRQVSQWPEWQRFVFAAMLFDFFFWLQHLLMHKVPWLWQLHTVHHSQKSLNFFSDFRYHVLEYFVRHVVVVIPLLILDFSPPKIVAYSIFLRTYPRFYHGNIRTDLGPLKYLLVTPQSHRVHHSALDEHRDKNFGAILSIWDWIFRTQYTGFDEYPRTGIPDDGFPNESAKTLKRTLFMPIVHMLYPLKVIARRASRAT